MVDLVATIGIAPVGDEDEACSQNGGIQCQADVEDKKISVLVDLTRWEEQAR